MILDELEILKYENPLQMVVHYISSILREKKEGGLLLFEGEGDGTEVDGGLAILIDRYLTAVKVGDITEVTEIGVGMTAEDKVDVARTLYERDVAIPTPS